MTDAGQGAAGERFEAHSRTFAMLTVVSRVTGLARDAALSRVFGAGPLTDAFFFAFTIPNLFRRLFGEGAASAAFLRVYARLERGDPAAARALATLMLGATVLVLGAVTLAAELALLGASGHAVFTARLMAIMLPYAPLICAVALLAAMLQVHGRFGASAAAPIVLNACLVGAAVGLRPLFSDPSAHLTAVAGSVLVAGVIQAVWMARALGRGHFAAADLGAARRPMRDVLRQLGPMLLGLGIFQINAFLDGLIASYPATFGPTIFGHDYPLATGAMTYVSYAQRLYQFPLGVFGIAVATAIFPALARQADDRAAFVDILCRGLRLVTFVGLPASVGLVLVAEPLSAAIYQGGHFDAADAHRVALVLLGYGAGVWAYASVHVLTRGFYARGDVRTPVRVAASMVALNLALNVTLIWTPLREAGLAWSTTACALLQMVTLLQLARRDPPGLLDGPVRRSAARIAVLTVAMAAAVVAVQSVLPAATTWAAGLLNLAASVGIGGVVFTAGAALWRLPELHWTVRRT